MLSKKGRKVCDAFNDVHIIKPNATTSILASHAGTQGIRGGVVQAMFTEEEEETGNNITTRTSRTAAMGTAMGVAGLDATVAMAAATADETIDILGARDRAMFLNRFFHVYYCTCII